MRLNPRCVLAAVLVLACGAAMAAPASVTGLGQSWPNATDRSASPRFHVYTFDKQGVRYVQVNDANGTVRGAIAVIGEAVVDLPIGVDAGHWSTVSSNERTVGESLYQDDAVTVAAVPQADGSIRLLMAQSECTNPAVCSRKDP